MFRIPTYTILLLYSKRFNYYGMDGGIKDMTTYHIRQKTSAVSQPPNPPPPKKKIKKCNYPLATENKI